MEKNEIPETTPFPRVFQALGEGCSLAANHFKLMLIPLVLDLLLLFGPRLRIQEYFQPLFEEAAGQMLSTVSASAAVQLEYALELMQDYLASINLFGFIQVFPVGVSLINVSGGDTTPLGNAHGIQMQSILQILPVIIMMAALGVLIGTLYFSLTARTAGKEEGKYSFSVYGKHLLNTILMYIALIFLIVMIGVPCSCVMSVTLMTFPVIYQILTIGLIVVFCWLLIPLFYIPHGIFMKDMSFPEAVSKSFKMASWSGTITVRFVLFSFIISLGMDLIWAIPEQSSWLILFSIFGHAYVSTALLAGSFVLYRDLDRWQKENRAFLEWRKANLRIKQLFKKEPEKND